MELQPIFFQRCETVKIPYHFFGSEYQEIRRPPKETMIEFNRPSSVSRRITIMPETIIQEIKFGR